MRVALLSFLPPDPVAQVYIFCHGQCITLPAFRIFFPYMSACGRVLACVCLAEILRNVFIFRHLHTYVLHDDVCDMKGNEG